MAGSDPVVAGPTLDAANSVGLDLELTILTPQPVEFLALARGQAVRPAASVAVGLSDPLVSNSIASSSGDLPPELRSQCGLCSGTKQLHSSAQG